SFELKRPKKKVIIQNSKPVVGEDFELDKMRISQTLKVESTAYTYTGNRTATGLVTREGLIAVDPRVIAMGSKVYVEGYGYAIAADTGGDIRGNRIDVFFSTLRQCIDWGRRPVHIYVLKPT
ncbi:3D domain-containing protein, partial [Desulfosporosinus sp. OT]|uniref:3D domain-containing protein n=1 Tax=Desulfosporosinus sp. OT TaxID=913865 RepID=UPI0002239FC5